MLDPPRRRLADLPRPMAWSRPRTNPGVRLQHPGTATAHQRHLHSTKPPANSCRQVPEHHRLVPVDHRWVPTDLGRP
eukprot:2920888-Pyramimonas_sp.AAC.2